MAVVTGDAGREAADIIQKAQQRQVPMLTVREAARRAGISAEGWNKVLKNGRGRVETVIAMARVVGVEEEVREAAGMPAARRSPQPDAPLSPQCSFERHILETPGPPAEVKREMVLAHRAEGHQAWCSGEQAGEGTDGAGLAEASL